MNSIVNWQEAVQKGWNFIDVRAPIEFAAGHLPGAVNLPILDDSERTIIGTEYKKNGKEAAVTLGHQLVSGNLRKAKIDNWEKLGRLQSQKTAIYCFRGGLRSQTAQIWLRERGLDIPIVKGGYKGMRQFLMSLISETSISRSAIVVSGATGSGKTRLLRELLNQRFSVLDFEKIANHRGSAFGALVGGQPSQALFENCIAIQMMKEPNLPILFEDESRLVGSMAIPGPLFSLLRNSPIVFVDEPIENRLIRVYEDYILTRQNDLDSAFFQYRTAIKAIERRLGGQRTSEILNDFETAVQMSDKGQGHVLHKIWIEKLLHWYYDPLYLGSLARRGPSVAFKGNYTECLQFCTGWKA